MTSDTSPSTSPTASSARARTALHEGFHEGKRFAEKACDASPVRVKSIFAGPQGARHHADSRCSANSSLRRLFHTLRRDARGMRAAGRTTRALVREAVLSWTMSDRSLTHELAPRGRRCGPEWPASRTHSQAPFGVSNPLRRSRRMGVPPDAGVPLIRTTRVRGVLWRGNPRFSVFLTDAPHHGRQSFCSQVISCWALVVTVTMIMSYEFDAVAGLLGPEILRRYSVARPAHSAV